MCVVWFGDLIEIWVVFDVEVERGKEIMVFMA